MIRTSFSQSGFSLVETLVAITILLIIVVGPMTIVSNATQGTNYSSEQVIAYALAQEGAELAQKARDDILLPYFETPGAANAGWNEFSTGAVYDDCFTGGCGLEIQTDAAGTVDAIDCNTLGDISNCELHLDLNPNERARYTYTDTGVDTAYTRIVTMNETAGREIRVVSRVTWRTGEQRQEQSAEVVTYLYNVYGR